MVRQAGYGKLRCGRVWQCSVSQGTFWQERHVVSQKGEERYGEVCRVAAGLKKKGETNGGI